MVKPFRAVGLRAPADRAEKTARTENAFQKERSRIRAANDAKTARLRGLRLEKEAAERQAAAEAAALAPPPARLTRGDAALRAATALMPSGAFVDGQPELTWVLPTEGAGEQVGQRVPRRLAWCVSGALRDGAAFELQLDAGNLALLGWDGAP